MSTKHTPGPWVNHCGAFIVSNDGTTIAQTFNKALVNYKNVHENAQRIVACVNAMEGIDDPQNFMEGVKKLNLDAYQRVAAERDELERWKTEAMELYKPIADFEHPEMKLCDSRVQTIMRLVAERDQFLAVLEECYNHALEAKKEFKILTDALKSIADMQPINQANTVACFHAAHLAAYEALEKLEGDGQNP